MTTTHSYQIPQILIITNNNHQEVVQEHLKKVVKNPTKDKMSLNFLNQEQESFKIEQARKLISDLAYAPFNQEKQCHVLLHFDLATIPAQNSLLKTLEEPPQNTVIVLTASTQDKILPTILSRCDLVFYSQNQSQSVLESDRELHDLLIDYVSQPKNHNFAEIIDISDKIKSKEEMLSLLSSLLMTVSSFSSLEKKHLIMENLLKSHQQIEQNVNFKLAFENCFFNIRLLHSRWNPRTNS